MGWGVRRLLGRTPRDTWLRLVAALAALSLIAAAAALLHGAQAKSRRQLESRQQDRAVLSAAFVESYVTGTMDREESVAGRLLAGDDGHPLKQSFENVVAAFGFDSAVLLDASGRAIAVWPSSPTAIGKNLADGNAHLKAALQGSRAVSAVVPSAVTGDSIVAFAVPFTAEHGRRVLSGGYVISETPLRAFLHNASALSGSASYLVDRSQQVVAAGSRLPDGVTTLAHLDGPLAGKLEHRGSGLYDAASGQRYFASAPITGTPWRLVTTSPRSALFAPVQGASRLVPWLIIGLLGLALMIAAPLAAGLVESRRALRASHEKLERRANVDELTGLFNRRHLREHLDAHVHAGRRHGYPVSVAILDLDHFKRVNDTFGHSAGDAVLSTVSSAIQAQLRQEDVLCRWGGEEFLLLLPYLGPEAAEQAVNRVRLATEQIAIPVGSGGDVIHVTLSAGVSTSRPDEHPDALIHRADLALYVAKSSGRNAVKLADIGVRSD